MQALEEQKNNFIKGEETLVIYAGVSYNEKKNIDRTIEYFLAEYSIEQLEYTPIS